MRARAVLQVHHIAADEARAVVRDRLDRAFEFAARGREPGHDRRQEHAGVDARIDQLADRAQPLKWMRGARFERPPRVLVDGRHAHADTAARRLRVRLQHVDVAHDHRSFRDQPDRRPAAREDFEALPRQFVVTLDRLIRIGGGSNSDGLTRPGRPVEFPCQYGDDVLLHQNHRREVVVGVQLELDVVAAREAVVTAVRATAIRVERPRERHAFDGIERRAASDFLIARLIGAALGFSEGGATAFFHRAGDVAGRRLLGTEIEEKWRRPHDIRLCFAT